MNAHAETAKIEPSSCQCCICHEDEGTVIQTQPQADCDTMATTQRATDDEAGRLIK